MIFISDIVPGGYMVTDSDSGMTIKMFEEELKQLSTYGKVHGYSEIPYKGVVLDNTFLPSFELNDTADYEYLAIPSLVQLSGQTSGYTDANLWTVYDLETHEKVADRALIYEARSNIDITLVTYDAGDENPYKVCCRGAVLFVEGNKITEVGLGNYRASVTSGGSYSVPLPTWFYSGAILRDSNLIDMWALFCRFVNYCVENSVADSLPTFFAQDSNYDNRVISVLRDSGLCCCSYEDFNYSRFFCEATAILRFTIGCSNMSDYETISSSDYVEYYAYEKQGSKAVFYLHDLGIFVSSNLKTTLLSLFQLQDSFNVLSDVSEPIARYWLDMDKAIEEVDTDILYPIYATRLFFADYLRYTKRHRFVTALLAACKSGIKPFCDYSQWLVYSSQEVILSLTPVIKDGAPDIELILCDIRYKSVRGGKNSTCTFKRTYLSTRIKERLTNWVVGVVVPSRRQTDTTLNTNSLLGLLNTPEIQNASCSGVPFLDIVFTFVTRYGTIRFDVENYKRFLGFDAEHIAMKSSVARAKMSGNPLVVVSQTGLVTEVRLPDKSINGVYTILMPKTVNGLSEDVLYKVLGVSWKNTSRGEDNIVIRFSSELESVKFKSASLSRHIDDNSILDVYMPHCKTEKVLCDLITLFGHSTHSFYARPKDEDSLIDILYVGITRACISPVAEVGHIFQIRAITERDKARYNYDNIKYFDYYSGRRLKKVLNGSTTDWVLIKSIMHWLDHSDFKLTENSFTTLMTRLYFYFDKSLSAFETSPKLASAELTSKIRLIMLRGLMSLYEDYRDDIVMNLKGASCVDDSEPFILTRLDDSTRYAFVGTSLGSTYIKYSFLSDLYDLAVLQIGEETVWRVLKSTGMFTLLPRFSAQAERLMRFSDSLDWDYCRNNRRTNTLRDWDMNLCKSLIADNFDEWFTYN